METDTIRKKIRHLFQAQGVPSANNQPLTGLGISQSPVLANLFNPNWDLAQFFNAAFKTALIAGAMLAVLRLGYAGFMYMTTDSFGNKGKAKTIIQDTVIGLLLLMSIWIILNQINPNLLDLNILRSVQSNPASGSGALPGGIGNSPY